MSAWSASFRRNCVLNLQCQRFFSAASPQVRLSVLPQLAEAAVSRSSKRDRRESARGPTGLLRLLSETFPPDQIATYDVQIQEAISLVFISCIMGDKTFDRCELLESMWESGCEAAVLGAAQRIIKTTQAIDVLKLSVSYFCFDAPRKITTRASAITIQTFFGVSDVLQKVISAYMAINQRLPDALLSDHDLTARSLIARMSTTYPQLFFKPIFTCAASDKPEVILKQLTIIQSISGLRKLHITLENAEMTLVALMSGDAKLGQLILTLELAASIKTIRESLNPVGHFQSSKGHP